MNSRNTAKKRLKNTIFRDRRDISPAITSSLKDEITMIISEFFNVDPQSATIEASDIAADRKMITYRVEIK